MRRHACLFTPAAVVACSMVSGVGTCVSAGVLAAHQCHPLRTEKMDIEQLWRRRAPVNIGTFEIQRLLVGRLSRFYG